MGLTQHFSAYSQWRRSVSANLLSLRDWLTTNELSDAQTELRLQQLQERLREDKLIVAFVAEFSRGKSELINAIFFGDYGGRVLPSAAGRTTMCPTELLYDAGQPNAIALLPIETRSTHASVAEFKRFPDEWRNVALDTASVEAMQSALARVSEKKRVSQEEAIKLGFSIETEDEEGATPEEGSKPEEGLKPGVDGLVEIPCWRHALINFPHPLLKQGLVILDTPGLNAIGAEPELTLSQLPSAHAILFILAADTGVTQSDLAVWRDHVNGARARRKGCIAVLNKVDGLWDGIRTDAEIEDEIVRQVHDTADILKLDPAYVFPVSAQKGLLAKISHDAALLAKSRLPALEQALTEELIPAKQDIVCDNIESEADDLVLRARTLLQTRQHGIADQLAELTELRGKNQGVIEYMMRKVKVEKEEFERGLQRYYAVRSVFSQLTNSLYAYLGMDALREETRRTRDVMQQATFSKQLREAMKDFFRRVRENLSKSSGEIGEITKMMEAMCERFAVEHGMKLSPPPPFSLLGYEKEIAQLETGFNAHFDTLFNMVTYAKQSLTQRFFETVATQVRTIFETVNRDVDHWLRTVMSPLETQVREYQLQLKRRLESIKRIYQATGTLEDRVRELEQMQAALETQLAQLGGISGSLQETLHSEVKETAQAAA
ncbi:MAG: dynamin family protein [Zoogloeaceae bacterium]|jgi:predicted GTPase|nr:dynamin family protein [Zoogloeaceae bacterium]